MSQKHITFKDIIAKHGIAMRQISFHGSFDDHYDDSYIQSVNEIIETSRHKHFVFHLAHLENANSTYISHLHGWHQSIQKNKGHMSIVNAPDHILQLFNIIGTTDLIDHHNSLEELYQTASAA